MNESRMSAEQRGPDDDRLDALFIAYRSACEPREVSANFMPELWGKIERVQSTTFSFRRIARGFVTAAAALSLAMGTVAVILLIVFLSISPGLVAWARTKFQRQG